MIILIILIILINIAILIYFTYPPGYLYNKVSLSRGLLH